MKNKQTRIIIGILVALVLFSASIALLMYSKQATSDTKSVNNIEVYIAKVHLSQGEMINAGDIEKAYLPKSYLSFTPLTQSEIMGRYAKVEIFAKEPLRKEKLSIIKPESNASSMKIVEVKTEVSSINESPTLDTITVDLSIFKNIDSSLEVGDHIDILSVMPKKKSKETEYITKYVALNVTINSFERGGIKTDTLVTHKESKAVYADAIVFEMLPSDIKNFLSLYYRTQELNSNRVFNINKDNNGHLWMVKCSSEVDRNAQREKNSMLLDHVVRYKKKKSIQRVSISYEN